MPDPISDAITAHVSAAVGSAVGPVLARVATLEARVRALESTPATPVPSPTPTPVPVPAAGLLPHALRMGANLSRAAYWSPSWPFADLVKTSGGGDEKVGPWMGDQVPLDADGWPLGLASGQNVHTVLSQGHLPAGTYTVTWEGEGTVVLGGSSAVAGWSSSPATVEIPAGAGELGLRIARSVPGRPVRNVQVLFPGCVTGGPLLRSAYVATLSPYAALRFMDWGATNGSAQRVWADRPQLSHRTWAGGVPYEAMIALANRLRVEPWICVPHLATEDYVLRLAGLVRSSLDPSLKVWIEYSNEVWLGGQANAYVEGLSPDTVRADYGNRAAQVMRWMEAGLGGRERLVRVLAGQAANPDVARQSLVAAPPGSFDALAHAPYMGGEIKGAPGSMTVDQVLDALERDVPRWAAKMVEAKKLADAHGLASVAYEGGQHLASSTLTGVFAAANRHPRMEAIYASYLAAWKASGSGLFCHFLGDAGRWGWFGSWTLTEWHDQAQGPKGRAVHAAAAAWRA